MKLICLRHLIPEENIKLLLYHRRWGYLTGYLEDEGYTHYNWKDYLDNFFEFGEISHWAKLPPKPEEEYHAV